MTTIQPTVGMGATYSICGDNYPCTIVEASGRSIVIQKDTAKLVSGSEQTQNAVYEIEPNPNAERETFTLRKNGYWYKKGEKMGFGGVVVLGERKKRIDPDA